MASETVGCPVFDAEGGLYLFGTRGDFRVLGSSLDQLSPLQVNENRPDFRQPNLVCMSSYNLNTVYFLNANSETDKIYYFDFGTQKFGFVTMTGAGPDLTTVQAIIDYDTLVIYAYSKGEMKRLGDAQDLNLSKKGTSLPWIQANMNNVPPNFSSDYVPTLAHAHFNLFFYGVPNVPNGNVWGFRIHYGDFGSQPQPVGSDFKSMHGQAVTLQFKWPEQKEHGGSPSHVVFIPDE